MQEDASTPTPGITELLRPIWTAELAPLFWPLARTVIDSAWVTHVPFAHWLVAVHRPAMLVELGTHSGLSYSAFCEAVQRAQIACRCLAFDTWKGDEHSGAYGEEIYTDLKTFHDARYAGFSELVRSTFDAGIGRVADGSIDLLHIDGFHTYDAVRHDFETWRPKLSPRAVVLFHDTNVRGNDFGVWHLWHELSLRHPSFEFLHGHGLGVLAVGEAQGPHVQALMELSNKQVNVVRDRFSTLGEHWFGQMRMLELNKHAGNLSYMRHMEAQENARLTEQLAAARATEEKLRQAEQRIQQLQARSQHLENRLSQALGALQRSTTAIDAQRQAITALAATPPGGAARVAGDA
jgi:hypothetical protein